MFYHVSKTYLGPTVVMEPRIPYSSIISKEGNIPRICVSTSIVLCLRSIASNLKPTINDIIIECKSNDVILNPAIYITQEEPYLPPKCSDFRRNKEHWFLTKTEFKFSAYICLKHLLSDSQLKLVRKDKTLLVDEYDNSPNKTNELMKIK